MERLWRRFESLHKRGRILNLDTKPEAGVIVEIGMGLMGLKANERDAYVLSAWQEVFTRRPSGVPAGPFLSGTAANFKRGFGGRVAGSVSEIPGTTYRELRLKVSPRPA